MRSAREPALGGAIDRVGERKELRGRGPAGRGNRVRARRRGAAELKGDGHRPAAFSNQGCHVRRAVWSGDTRASATSATTSCARSLGC